MLKSQPKIILASTSPQRIKILKNAGFEFEVIPSNYHEPDEPFLSPEELAKSHAFHKAKIVADTLEEGIVIGCDTIVSHKGKAIQKPKDALQAKMFIQMQQGQVVQVISGLSIFNIDTNRNVNTTVTTDVYFSAMSETEIDWYIATKEWKDKSGGFSIQGIGSRYIYKIVGDYQNVVGLPLFKVYEILKSYKFFT
jgi:septum formation protein